MVKGTWVYDNAHEGWNEIHPIKQCQRIQNSGGGLTGWPSDTPSRAREWCKALDDAGSDATTAAQGLSENQWVIHPVIDGCRPVEGGHNPPIIK